MDDERRHVDPLQVGGPVARGHDRRELARGAEGTRLATTLDLTLQRAVEAIAAEGMRLLELLRPGAPARVRWAPEP